jgi:cytoskeleton protein RodZ
VLNPPKPAAKPAPQPVVAPPQTAVPSPAADSVPPAAATLEQQQASAMPPPAAGAKTPATTISPRAATPPTAGAPAQTASAVPAVSPGQVFGALNRNPRVVLRARNDARVTVRGPDGQILLNRDLKAGDVYQVPNMPGSTLAASDGGAVEIDVDGIALGRAGQSQQILGRVSLDPQSLTDRFNNH